MNKKPKVSIVIPTFNRKELLQKTIECALNQTYQCEVIVCDHGSSDGTLEMMKKYANKIKYVRRNKDYGINFCWLDGVVQSEGEFVHIHLDDDLMAHDYIEKALDLFDDSVGFVFSDAYLYFYDDDRKIENCLGINYKFGTGVFSSKKLEKKIFKEKLMLSPAVCLYRRKDVLDALYPGSLPIDFGGEYKGVGPDHLMTLLCLLRYEKFGCIGESLVTFGAHAGSITIDSETTANKKAAIRNAYDAIRNYYQLLKLYKNNPECISIKQFGSLFKRIKTPNEKKVFVFGIPVYKSYVRGDGKKNRKILGIRISKCA